MEKIKVSKDLANDITDNKYSILDTLESIAMILSSPVADDRAVIGAIEKEIEGFYGKKIFADTDTEYIKEHYCKVCGDKYKLIDPKHKYCKRCDILHIKGE